MIARPREIGGEFHWSGLPNGPFTPWPSPHRLFSLGRVALGSLWRDLQDTHRSLWLPDYFCPETASYWARIGIPLQYYVDNPTLPCPEWTTLAPRPGDLVLSLNYFGVRSGQPWHKWHQEHPNVVLVEDHTHDPLSTWAQKSNADYALASLRKVFAAPEGALLWSPRGYRLPDEPQNHDWAGSALKLAGMIFKAEYLAAGESDSELKETFRQFQIAGEKHFDDSPDQSLSPWSQALLARGFPNLWRERREMNVRYLLERLVDRDLFQPLFTDWPLGHCPFNLILLYQSEEQREQVRSGCLAANIYSPIHWRLNHSASDHSLDISQRILTVPVDHRYHAVELDRIVAVLHQLAQ